MYTYRLTRRGKIVVSVFAIILLYAASTLSMGMTVRGQNNLSYMPLSISTDFEVSRLVDTKSNGEKTDDIHVDNLVMINSYKSNENIETLNAYDSNGANAMDDVLSIDVEKAYVYADRKTAFLTFDDGPSMNVTPRVLDVLKKYNIKATFFVLGSLAERNSTILKDILNSGHAIGIHSYSHDYKIVYKNAESFINEIRMTADGLRQTLGEGFTTRLFRFPGGSFESYKKHYKDVLAAYGYISIDWNVITGDGEYSDLPLQTQLDRLKSTMEGKQQLVVLMHDSASKTTTADALPGIIEYLKSLGYEFAVLK